MSVCVGIFPFRKAEQLFENHEIWKAVHDRDRREIFEDAIIQLAKKEKEEAKQLRKRNIKVFTEILDNMPSLSNKTTWSEAQQMLLDNPTFTDDPDLQSKFRIHLFKKIVFQDILLLHLWPHVL